MHKTYNQPLFKMNKSLITLAVLAMMSSCVYAQQITEQQAKERALQFLTDGGKAKSRSAAPTGKLLKKASVEVSNLYAYNIDGGGFVIVSGDERTIPVLGYSDNGQIDWQHMPENMRSWLTNYSQAIHALGNAELGLGAQPINTGRVAIEPLLKTQWNQYEPYWNKCPFKEDMGRMCLTGCVATAMAQVMNYHQWPKEACQSIPAYDVGITSIDHYDELPATTFDWDNMIPSYEKSSSTAEQQDAVATLMRYCGQSVQMLYGAYESSTDGGLMADALKLYFDYNPNLYYANRTYYGIDEWEDLIYQELAANRPVPYCGQTDQGGHCFVCDGYDGNGLFHINWGWNGDADGYFSLSLLNPKRNTGAGASTSKLGYCMFEEAIIGMQPSTGGTPEFPSTLMLFGNIALDGNTVKFSGHYDNIPYPKASFEMALGTMDGEGKLTPVAKAEKPYTVEMRFNIDAEVSLGNAGLAPGTYHLMPMARCVAVGDEPAEGPWHLLSMPERKVQTVVTSDGVICTLEYLPDLAIEKAYVSDGTSVPSEPNDVTLEIKNKGHEYSGELMVRTWFMGDKTSQEAFSDLPPVSELKQGTRTGGYLKANSTENLVIPIQEGNEKGNYLVLLYEAYSDVLLDTATIVLDQDYQHEFVNLEVVDYKFEYKPSEDIFEGFFSYDVTIKNNDANYNWPKYHGISDQIALNATVDGLLVIGYQDMGIRLAKGNEVRKSQKVELLIDDIESPCIFTLTEKLADGRTKDFFTIEIKPGETLVYPATGISTVTTEQSSGKTYNLQGRIVPDNANIRKGIYLKNGKKIIIK